MNCTNMNATSRRAHGLTLVELMVGMAVGLFVSLIAISVFVSTRSLNVVNSSSSRMSENGRLAMDVLRDDLRSAGFQGCFDRNATNPLNPAANQASSVLNTPAAANAGFLADGLTGVAGHNGTGAAFLPPLALFWNALPAEGQPDLASDILSLRVPVDNLSLGLTVPMVNAADRPQVGASTPGNTFKSGDIALITSCRVGGTIFQITSASPFAGDLEHTTDVSFVPGNADAALTQTYGSQAAVYRLQTRHYYVAPSVLRAGTNSLWRLTVPPPPGASPIEIAVGIDRIKVAWGIDTTGDLTVDRYVSADNVPGWDQVVSARLQLLVATAHDGATQSAQTIDFDGASWVATDRRLRTVLTEVVALRSRVP